MQELKQAEPAMRTRRIIHRTKGRRHGPITRLVSPGDVGEWLKPFVFLDLFEVGPGGGPGFGYHPHSGIATLTISLKGVGDYEDSTGEAGVMVAGAVEWMRAGGGVWHRGGPVGDSEALGFQLWVALPEALENSPAESLYLDPEALTAAGPARVILGEHKGVSSPIPPVADMTYLHVTLQDGERWTYAPPSSHEVGFVALNAGRLEVSGAVLERELAIFEDGAEPLTFQAHGAVSFVLGSAARHPHPLVLGYYSVHTSPEALAVGEAGIERIGARLKAQGVI